MELFRHPQLATDILDRCRRAGHLRPEFRGLPLGETDHAYEDPPHIGGFIARQIIEPAGLSVTAAAKVLGVSRPSLSQLLNERAGLSGEMALRIEKAFGVKMDLLMRMQLAYNIAQARKQEKAIKVRPFLTISALQ